MKYMFDVELATLYGTDEAIFLENLIFWVIRNRANEKNFFDGRTWTYNSVRALKELFPFWSDYQMRRVLDSLIKQGVIVKGNYNKNPYDRTMWYALADEEKLIFRYQNFHLREPKNGVSETREPIPDIKPDIKPDININDSKPETAPACGAPSLEKEKETALATAVKGKDGFLYVKPEKDDDPEQLAEWNKSVKEEPVLFGKQFVKEDLRGFAKEPAQNEPQRAETATDRQLEQNEQKNAPRAGNDEKSESGVKKERKPTRLFEFAQWVAKVFDYEIEEGAQFQLWFKRNCRTLKFILEYSGDNFQRGLMMIKACHDSLDAQNLTFSYESVTRRAPEWYAQAKQWYESGRRMGVTDSGEFKLI